MEFQHYRMLWQAVNCLQGAKGAGYEARKKFNKVVTTSPRLAVWVSK